MKSNREVSIDALRGIAILGMVLSGTIIQSADIPGWMYHAQVGPPDFKFHPEIPGITWVDLVFPFFLFAMGLSFPFSMNKYLDSGKSKYQLAKKIGLRTFNLFLFAIMLPHLSFYNIPEQFGISRYMFSLIGFFAFFLTFSKFPLWQLKERTLNYVGYGLLISLVYLRYHVFDIPFSIHKNDIIILVLANMALVASLIWMLTRKNWWPRLAILAFYLGLRLTAGIENSFNHEIYHFTFLKYLGNTFPSINQFVSLLGIEMDKTIFYSMYFMKYLFIVIPGTIIGDILYKLSQNENTTLTKNSGKTGAIALFITLLAFLTVNLIGLYTRENWLIIGGNILLFAICQLFINQKLNLDSGIKNWLNWSFFWLFLGIMFEPYEGGIKKDVATMSYFFITSGLAGLLLLAFKIGFEFIKFEKYFNFLQGIGKNPMLGYVAAGYLIIPVFGIVGIMDWINNWSEISPYLGILRGMVLTIIMILVTLFTVKIKHFWKT